MKHQLTVPDLMRNRVLRFNESLLRGREPGLIIDSNGRAVISIPELIKRKESNSTIRIGTHGDDYPGPGHHHADEILSAALIRVLLNTPITVVCTRNEQILDTCDLVIDVGEGLLDHHGSQHEEYISSCVKVFMLCKQTLLSGQVPVFAERENHPEFYPLADICCRVAAQDTGHEIVGNDPFPWFQTIVYYARGCYKHGVKYTDEQLVGNLLTSMCDELAAMIYNEIWRHEAFDVTYSKIKDQKGKPYMVFDEEDQESDIKQMIWRAKSHDTVYFITKEMNGTYRVCCCAKNSPQFNKFSTKHPIPVCFRGLTKLELDEAAGLNPGDSIFCHKQGFVAGFTSLNAAIQFCECILRQKGDQNNV